MFIVVPPPVLQTVLPPWTVILLPLATSAITGVFEVEGAKHPYAPLFNALVASLFFLIGAALIFILSGSLSGNFGFDAIIYLTLLGLLMQAPPCMALYEAVLSVVPSPLKVLFDLLDKSIEPTPVEEERPSAYLTKMPDVHNATTIPEVPKAILPPEGQ